MARGAVTAALGMAFYALTASPALGQLRPDPGPDMTTPAPLDISPGGAFWRAILVPGWGHAAIGSYTRAGFYVFAQGTTTYTLLRTRTRIGEVQDRVRFRERVLRRRLEAEGVTGQPEIDAAFDADQPLAELRGLLDSRREQQEDLVALALAFLFISGADAYVSAHLARFPEPLVIEGAPNGTGGVEVSLRIPLPN